MPRGKKSAGSQSQIGYGSLGRPAAKEPKEPALLRKATMPERSKKFEGKGPGDYFHFDVPKKPASGTPGGVGFHSSQRIICQKNLS